MAGMHSLFTDYSSFCPLVYGLKRYSGDSVIWKVGQRGEQVASTLTSQALVLADRVRIRRRRVR